MTEDRFKKIMKLVEELQLELAKVIRASVSNAIEVMFHDQILVMDAPPVKPDTDIICVLVESEQQYMKSFLRFSYDSHLLSTLVTQIYGPDIKIDRKVLEDAACEISNIVSKRVKAFLNSYGMAIEMDIPFIERKSDQHILETKHITHIHFLLNENQMGVDFAYSFKTA